MSFDEKKCRFEFPHFMMLMVSPSHAYTKNILHTFTRPLHSDEKCTHCVKCNEAFNEAFFTLPMFHDITKRMRKRKAAAN